MPGYPQCLRIRPDRESRRRDDVNGFQRFIPPLSFTAKGNKKGQLEQPAFYALRFLLCLEAVAIFQRVHETLNHVSRIARLIEHRNPIKIERIRISTQITEVLHYHERLVVVLVINL